MNRLPGHLGVVLVDHGSQVAAANELLDDVVRLFRERTGAAIVEPAHMELAEPTIRQAIGCCVEQGAREIMVHPYFLAPGRHSADDIPRLVAEAAAQHAGVAVWVTEPLGLDDRMVEVIQDRILEALAAKPRTDES